VASAERQILNLLHVYAERVDQGDFDGVAALFEHGDYRMDGTSPLRGAGVAAAMRSMVQLDDRGRPGTNHVITNTILDVHPHGASAEARSYFTVFQVDGSASLQPILAGRYHDRFEAIDGVWRFADRRIAVDQVGDLSRHLRSDMAVRLEPGQLESGG
jgi:3-phenylpropionate/cinnamic acid dioxygenase small subunit